MMGFKATLISDRPSDPYGKIWENSAQHSNTHNTLWVCEYNGIYNQLHKVSYFICNDEEYENQKWEYPLVI